MKKMMLLIPILLAACVAKVTTSPPHENLAIAYITAQDSDATCEESALLVDAQRAVDGKPLEQVDAAFCKASDGYLYACTKVYEKGRGVACAKVLDSRSPEERAKAQAAARPAAPAPATPPVDAGADAAYKSGADVQNRGPAGKP